jgi:hypothetical protein
MVSNSLDELREEVANLKVNLSRHPFEWHEISNFNAKATDEDYESIVAAIKENGYDVENKAIIITKDGLVLDGRHRQRACVELSLDIPYKQLTKEYDKLTLMEYVMESETGRRENKTQLAIKAYRLKRTVAGLTYKDVAQRMGCSERMVRQVNTLYVAMKEFGSKDAGFNPEEVFEVLMNGMVCKPSVFPWLTEPKSSIGGLLKAFQEYLGRVNSIDDYDSTMFEKVLDESTGEYVLREIQGKLVKKKDTDMISIEEHNKIVPELKAIILELKKEIDELKAKLENQG